MRFRRFLAFTAGLAALASSFVGPFGQSQEATRPVAIVSIAPIEDLLQDTSYLLRAANVPELGGLVSIMANQYTQGLDRSKPIGMAVRLEGQMPTATIFMPVSDRSKFFGALAGMGIEPDDLGDGLFEIDASGQTVFAKHIGDWMFVAQSEDALANLPADPSKALGELPKQYDVAFRVNVQALPPELKEMATQQMRIGFERGMAEQRDQTAEDREAAKQIGEAQIAQIEQLISDTEQIIFGWNAEPNNQRVYIDVAAQFLEGSKLAAQVAAMRNMASDYTDFAIPGAAARFRFTSQIADEDKPSQLQNLRNTLAQLEKQQAQLDMPAEARALIKESLQGFGKVAEQTIQEGVFDGAGSVSLADDTLRILVGGRLADGRSLAQELKRIAEGIPDGRDAPKFEFDYGTYKGRSLHRVLIPVKIADPDARKLFGDTLTVSIGTADKGFLIALDPDGDATLKAAIDRMDASQGENVSPFDGVIELGQLLRFAQSVSPNSFIDNAVQTIQQFSDNDKIEITGRMIERGGMYRISVDEGVLRAAGAAAKAGQANGGF